MLEPSEASSAPQPPAEARRRARRESFHQHQGGLAEGKGMVYFAKEVRLTKKHEEILAQRLLLLEEMENDHGDQKTEKKASLIKAAKLAYKRNQDLLNDIRTLEEKIEKKVHLRSHPEMVNLQTLYWASVEEQAPKWEQFLLGKAQYPTGVRCQSPAGNDIRDTAER
ncbi:centrosomal protein 15 isoform X1 [Petaurus breviceps papuanus]|uniref:centrosomal protein 15 isoform X1 n=1 Tax=Petaurus breviceps papuanus TaxID=3040969 RepID=UPI0036DF6FF5